MTPRAVGVSSGWLALPLFVGYTAWTLTYGITSMSSWAVVGIVLAALPIVGVLTARAEGLAWLAPSASILLGFVLGLLGLTSLLHNDLAGLGVLGGVLLGFPLAVVAAIVRWGRDPPSLLVLTVGGVAGLLTTRAAFDRLWLAGVDRTPAALAIASGQVTYDQLLGFASLLGGSSSATLPLQSLADVAFGALLLLALVGVFLAFFTVGEENGRPRAPDPGSLLLPVVFGVLAAAAFEVSAARAPRVALLGLAVVVAGVVVAVLVLARQTRIRPTPSAETLAASEPPRAGVEDVAPSTPSS
jgi:hypothetical protein